MKDSDRTHHHNNTAPYIMFAVNMLFSSVVMYLVMFSMIDSWSDFRNNLNMVYMTLTMVAPMGILMLMTMGKMYANRKLNNIFYLVLVVMFLAAFAGTRTQAFIGDREFITSMIPHHSGAVLMCRQARLKDPELVTLCAEITRGQRSEIEQMNGIQARLDIK